MTSGPSHPTGQAARFSEVLSEAIARRNLTLERISHLLREAGTPVSIATLSYWQTGRSTPTRGRSLKAVDELEKILRVPVGHLSHALETAQTTPWDPIGEIGTLDEGELQLRQMGFSTRRDFTTSWVQDTVTVLRDEGLQLEATRQQLVATVEGLDRIPLVLRKTDIDDVPPRIEAVTACTLGRAITLDRGGIVAAELLLPHPLAKGESAMVEYQVTWDVRTESDHGFGRVLVNPVEYHVLAVGFQGEPAEQAHYFNGSSDDPEGLRHQPLHGGNQVQIVLADPAPGIHGLSWTFASEQPAPQQEDR